MDKENMDALENLGFYCYLGGIICIFLGLGVVFINVIHTGLDNIQMGLFILAIGYALVKISAKITRILNIEKDKLVKDTDDGFKPVDGQGYRIKE